MTGNKTLLRLAAVAVIVGLAAAAYVMRPAADSTGTTVAATETVLPRLLDLGADKCVPCKMMAPILDELKVEYTEVFAVEFIDVWKNPGMAESYKVKVIPTQIFFSAEGEELYRHEGFFGREDILAKWRELGVTIQEEGV